MSLVAYGGSSDEGDSSDEEPTSSNSGVSQNQNIVSGSESSSNLFTALPKPKPKAFSEEEILQTDDDPQKEIPSSFSNITATRVKGVTRIGIPSLKNLNKEIEDDELPKRKIAPSKKGSGLFAILPEPKRLGKSGGPTSSNEVSFLKITPSASSSAHVAPIVVPKPLEPTDYEEDSFEPDEEIGPQTIPREEIDFQEKAKLKPKRQLIPHVVSQTISGKRTAPTRMDEIRAKYMKQEANVVVVSRSAKPPVRKDSDSSDDEGEDFFSFTSKADELSEADYNTFKLPPPPVEGSQPQIQPVSKPIDYEEENPISMIPEEVMKFVQKGKNKRAKQENVNFIDVRADSLRLESHEMLKTITDTSLVPPRPITGGPGGLTKKKHQITYLAFEAKAREQELQNQWAQNRHSKRLTQNKYGF